MGILCETNHITETVPLSRNQNSPSNFAFPSEFCQDFEILWKFCLKQLSSRTPFPCLGIKILLRILLRQQNFVRILRCYGNFVSNGYRHGHRSLVSESNFYFEFFFPSRIFSQFCNSMGILSETDHITETVPLSRNQNSPSNFAFPPEFSYNFEIRWEFCLNQLSSRTPFLWLGIKILLRILLFHQNFFIILRFYGNLV